MNGKFEAEMNVHQKLMHRVLQDRNYKLVKTSADCDATCMR